MTLLDDITNDLKKAQKLIIRTSVSSNALVTQELNMTGLYNLIEADKEKTKQQLTSFSGNIDSHIKGNFSKQIKEALEKQKVKIDSIFGD